MFRTIFDVVGEYPTIVSTNYMMDVIPSRVDNEVYIRIYEDVAGITESFSIAATEEVFSGLYRMIHDQIPGANLDESLAVLFLYARWVEKGMEDDFTLSKSERARIRREGESQED